jgi:pimeloyl-ACP methyl ester carboxylesterase
MVTGKKRKKHYMVLRIVSGLILSYLVYCCVLFLLQRRVLFPRHAIGVPASPAANIPGLEEMWLPARFGKVEAWFLPPKPDKKGGPAPAVIFAHGNAELIDFWPQEFSNFALLGMGLLLVEYPGYGRSEGAPSQKTIQETFTAAYDVLVARKDVDSARIVIFGRSLGGAAACALAAERPSAGLILMSTFVDVKSFAKKFLVPGFLIQDPFDNLAVVRAYDAPVLVIHGKYDTLIPYKHGMALYKAAKRGQMITYNSDHNDCPPSWNVFWQDVASFLRGAGIIEKQRDM